MQIQIRRLALASALLVSASAHALGDQQAELGNYFPDTSGTSAPSNWRFAPGQLFNGVAALDGVARLSFTTSGGGSYACSGSLLAGGLYVLTAGHCGDDFTSMTVQFGFANGVAAVTRTVAAGDVTLHPAWQGFDNSADAGSDLAILKLNAPVTTIQGYQLSTTNDLGKTFLMAGYGTVTQGGSNAGSSWSDSAFGHYGYNTADVDSKTFNLTLNNFVPGWGATAGYYVGTTYMSDFDDGTAGSNTLGRIAGVTGSAWSSGTGLGANEALIA
ncbi:MAG TPA: trypsin-like serine protease, partial [Burkholderiaceae bacterium]